jgi:hypothetical protein
MTLPSTGTAPTPPRVLFVGDDASSPEIAASLLRRLAGDRVAVETAGTRPVDAGGRSDEMLVAMGLDPAREQPLSTRVLHTADRVIILGAGLDVARLSGPRYEEWNLADDDLVARVQMLSDDLTAGPVARSGSAVLDRLRTLIGVNRRR